jgi:hypothetical protein
LAQCEVVKLVTGDILCEHDAPYLPTYFPLRGVIALVTIMGRYRPLEMGLIGNEGMLGATLALGVGTAPMRALVQGAVRPGASPATASSRNCSPTRA